MVANCSVHCFYLVVNGYRISMEDYILKFLLDLEVNNFNADFWTKKLCTCLLPS